MALEPRNIRHRVDPDSAARLKRQGGDKLVQVLTESFLARTPERLASARLALGDGDVDSVHITVHNLKSSCLLIGALYMGEVCREAEKLTRRRQSAGLAPMLDDLAAEFERIRPWVLEMQRNAAERTEPEQNAPPLRPP